MKGTAKYRLRCIMCYYGEHYAAYALSEAPAAAANGNGAGGGGGGGARWLLFDDTAPRVVGGGDDVVASCEKGRLQPCVLFYQEEGAEAAGPV